MSVFVWLELKAGKVEKNVGGAAIKQRLFFLFSILVLNSSFHCFLFGTVFILLTHNSQICRGFF